MEYLYKNLSKISNLQDYVLSNFSQYVEMTIYSVVSFFIPLMIGHPQIVVGVIVNAMLITAALNLKGYKLLPVILIGLRTVGPLQSVIIPPTKML